MSKKTITVKCCDGELLEVDEAVALKLQIVDDSDLAEDDRYRKVYTVENLTGQVLAYVVELYKKSLVYVYDDAVPNLSDSEWQTQVVESDIPVMVEFWAPMCGPLHMIHPIADQLTKDFAGKFKFYKMNIDESPNTVNRYSVPSIPTVIIFKDGEKKEIIFGVNPRETLEKSIERFLVE